MPKLFKFLWRYFSLSSEEKMLILIAVACGPLAMAAASEVIYLLSLINGMGEL